MWTSGAKYRQKNYSKFAEFDLKRSGMELMTMSLTLCPLTALLLGRLLSYPVVKSRTNLTHSPPIESGYCNKKVDCEQNNELILIFEKMD